MLGNITGGSKNYVIAILLLSRVLFCPCTLDFFSVFLQCIDINITIFWVVVLVLGSTKNALTICFTISFELKNGLNVADKACLIKCRWALFKDRYYTKRFGRDLVYYTLPTTGSPRLFEDGRCNCACWRCIAVKHDWRWPIFSNAEYNEIPRRTILLS